MTPSPSSSTRSGGRSGGGRGKAPGRRSRGRKGSAAAPAPRGPCSPEDHAVSQYARDVVEGKVLAGKWVRLACERHLRDLREGPARGLRFDVVAADRVIRFFTRLRHTQGKQWIGQPIRLIPWQQFVVGSIYGWKRADGNRRFRIAYVETGKKTGKSTLAGGLGLYTTFFDDPPEPGAQGYTAATVRKQARATFDEAREQVLQAPGFRRYVKSWGGDGHNMRLVSVLPLRQVLMPLGKDSDGLDGVNVHFAVVDELHKHRDRTIWDVLVDSRKARSQPLVLAITNAGFDPNSICYEIHRRAEQILEGSLPNDDSFFAFIACIDKGDDWADPKVWIKANPSLGSVVKMSDYEEDRDRALASPSYVNTFRRYGCGEWVAVDERAIDLERWKLGGKPFDEKLRAAFRLRDAYLGLDLARSVDIAALTLFFPPTEEDEKSYVLCWFWRPEATLLEASKRDNADYPAWVRDGLMETTPGFTIQFKFVRKRIAELRDLYRIRSVCYDPWSAPETVDELQETGVPMVKVIQGHKTLGAPTAKMEEFYMAGNLHHGGNPVLLWMASNVVWRYDPNMNFIPDKAKAARSGKRIDGISALVTAMAGSGLTLPEEEPDIYSTRGPIRL